MSSYREVLARLSAARRFGMKLGLERMRELLDRLGQPDRRLGTIVHVAGTNGKGSTVAMIAALARAGGKRVAAYTSPHLSSLRERITIDGVMASEAAIVEAAARVEAAGGAELTFFEQVTAIGVSIIADAGVDVTVLEVGLGGRLDATNAIATDIAVITGVALDHEAILGNTLEAIASEKAGIVKPGQRVVIGASGEAAIQPRLVELARAAGAAEVIAIDAAAIARVPVLGLVGPHQRANAAAACAAGELLGCAYPETLAGVSVPGRFELTGDTILDGAHNPHGARALAATLRERGIEPVLIMAVSADKDVRAMIDALAPAVRAVVATRYQQERALEPAALADAWRQTTARPVHTAPTLADALATARSLGAPILIAGSLFLVGEARVMLLGAPADPIGVTDPVRPA